MIKTFRFSIGFANDDPNQKREKIIQFDDQITAELDSGLYVIEVHSHITSSDEEIMIAVLGDKSEVQPYIPIFSIVIFFLILITFRIWF